MAVETEGVEFSFGALKVLRGVSLSMERGTALAVFGPNGAGKTTFLKILAGLLRPEKGRVQVEGIELHDDPARFRRSIGVISHQPYLYPQLTGRENLEFYARLYSLDDPKAEVRRMLDEMGLSSVADRAASAYSRGMLQRLAIGRALLHQPPVLLLDEPFIGLDYQAREKLEALLQALRDGKRTVLMTSHDIDGGWGLADRVVIMDRGSIALEASTTDLDRTALLARYREVTAEGRSRGVERAAS